MKDYETFFRSYVDQEFDLWKLCYGDVSSEIFWKERDNFKQEFYANSDLDTEIRRMKNPDQEWIDNTKEYLAVTYKRKIFQSKVFPDPRNLTNKLYAAYLSTKQQNSNSYFELIIAQNTDNKFKIISSYITDHDNWFEYNMGIDLGELKPPLNALEVMKYIPPEKQENLEEYQSE
jgi:hypothetical protein